jgi:DNA-binding MarR family transcriptional regulator
MVENSQSARSGLEDGADEALAMLRAMVKIADSTVAEVTAQLTLTQFRALVIIAERKPPVIMGRVAEELAMNPSSVTRACDRLVQLELVQRARNPLNKRETLLAPTTSGREIVARVNRQRRTMLAEVLDRMSPAARSAAVEAFARFAEAAGSPED